VQRFLIADLRRRDFNLFKNAIENRITQFNAPRFIIADPGCSDFQLLVFDAVIFNLLKNAIENRITQFNAPRFIIADPGCSVF